MVREIGRVAEPKLVGMGVPAVGFSVGDFKGAYQAPRWFHLHPGTATAQDLEGFTLLGDEIPEGVPLVVGEGEGDEDRGQALGLGPVDGVLNLQAAALLDAGGADGAGPDAATGDEAGVEGGAMLKGAHDLNVRMAVMAAIAGAVAVPRVGGRVEATGALAEDVRGMAQGLVFQGSGGPCLRPVRGRGRGFRSST